MFGGNLKLVEMGQWPLIQQTVHFDTFLFRFSEKQKFKNSWIFKINFFAWFRASQSRLEISCPPPHQSGIRQFVKGAHLDLIGTLFYVKFWSKFNFKFYYKKNNSYTISKVFVPSKMSVIELNEVSWSGENDGSDSTVCSDWSDAFAGADWTVDGRLLIGLNLL